MLKFPAGLLTNILYRDLSNPLPAQAQLKPVKIQTCQLAFVSAHLGLTINIFEKVMLHVHAICSGTSLQPLLCRTSICRKSIIFLFFTLKMGVPLCCQCQTVKDMQTEVNIVFV